MATIVPFEEYPTNHSDGADFVTETNHTKTELKVMMLISISISAIGTVSNVISLSYFVTHQSKKLGERLIALLNILDLLVCLFAAFYLAFTYWQINAISQVFFHLSYFMFLECTGFVTTLLTVARSVSTYCPFYEPNTKLVIISFAAFMSYTLIKEGLLWYYVLVVQGNGLEQFVKVYNYILLISLILDLTVVLTANLMTMWKLLKRGISRDSTDGPCSTDLSRQATGTILILSAFFGFFNLLYVVVLFKYVLGKETISAMFRNVVVNAAIPMNSALNPFVYLFRKKEMRRFLYRIFCRRSESLSISRNSINLVLSRSNYVATIKCPRTQTTQLYSPATILAGGHSAADSRENGMTSRSIVSKIA